MSRINRNILHSGRRHHGPQQNVRSIYLDGTTDFITAGNNYGLNNTPADNTTLPVPDQNNTAYLWRLLNTIHLNDGAGLNYYVDIHLDPIASQFGETAMSVAMWFKPAASADQGGLPVSRTTSVTTNTWKTIWMSDQNTSLTDLNGGIGIGIWYEGSTQSNYFAMFKYGGVAGAPGRAIRVGSLTPILENIGDQSTYTTYTPTWFHVAFKWTTCNQELWEMWVNGILQNNNFGSNNLGYDGTELSTNAYCYASQVVEAGYASTTDSSILGGGFGTTPNITPRYIGGHFADFNYWHASLSNHDVAALYNWGSLYGDGIIDARLAPTSNFTVTGDELVGNSAAVVDAAIQNDQSFLFLNPSNERFELTADHADFSFAEDTGADPDTPFTFALWLNPSAYQAGILSNTSGTTIEYRIFTLQNGSFFMDIYEGGGYARYQINYPAIPNDTWSHLMITKGATFASFKIYVNSIDITPNVNNQGSPTQMRDLSPSHFLLGKIRDSAYDSYDYEGKMCQFMMWKGYQADQNAVTYLYGAGAVHRDPLVDNPGAGYTGASSLKCWLPLHTDANDISGNNHHFTADAAGPFITTGAGNSPFAGNQ